MAKVDKSGARDDVLFAMGEDDTNGPVVVGNEQWADAEGVKGPDPDQWDKPDKRKEPEGVETPPGYFKKGSKSEWGDKARAERGADPDDNPQPAQDEASKPMTTDDTAPSSR